MGEERQVDGRRADADVTVRRPRAHLRSIGRQPGDVVPRAQPGLGEELPEQQHALPAEPRHHHPVVGGRDRRGERDRAGRIVGPRPGGQSEDARQSPRPGTGEVGCRGTALAEWSRKFPSGKVRVIVVAHEGLGLGGIQAPPRSGTEPSTSTSEKPSPWIWFSRARRITPSGGHDLLVGAQRNPFEEDGRVQGGQELADLDRIPCRRVPPSGVVVVLSPAGGRRHLASGHPVDGVVDEDHGEVLAAVGGVDDLGRADRGEIAVPW